MGVQILSGLQALGTTRTARSPLVTSPEWQQIVNVLSNGGLNSGDTLRITISPETHKLSKNAALGLRKLLLNALQPLWDGGSPHVTESVKEAIACLSKAPRKESLRIWKKQVRQEVLRRLRFFPRCSD